MIKNINVLKSCFIVDTEVIFLIESGTDMVLCLKG